MPLSVSKTKRERIHERKVTCVGYRREDGLWDIEGHLTDKKAYDFSSDDRGQVPAGEPVHEMWLRITVDDELVIRATEAATDYAPFKICGGAVENFSKLKDIKIGPGFRKHVAQIVGGTSGCTHLRELLGPMATTAFQTIVPIKARERNGTAAKSSSLIGTCHAYAPDSDVVKRLWPEHESANR